ncbi:unnamed protein product [Trypanosoma congolense IL3000]|uniref:WGS project CAEQ00000000 data, annotated contig 2008 n=1 Tax=Trypanosoma congolense (strain IL3000) TaxID=1068625 RepID=F9WAR7_TRYCI|nr:unnamed protein product [Trypanosoma congolense IL3000]
MYRQNTNFVAANTPLLQQLFGFQPLEPSPSIAVATQAQDSQYHTGKHHLTPRPSPPGHTKSAVGPPPFFSVVEDCPGEISPCVDPRVPQSEGSMRCGEFSSVERANDNDVSDDNDALVKAEPALPFRQVMQELERRFHEQMEVHRVLNSTMDRLDTLQAEVSLYQAEQRTLKLAAALREVNALPVDASVQAFAGAQKQAEASTHVSPPSATAPTDAGSAPAQGDKSSAAANPLLTSILESYEKERESRLRAKRGATADTAQKEEKPPLDIIRPPEAPRPYKRVYYVPIEDATTQTPEDVGAEVADDSALTGN